MRIHADFKGLEFKNTLLHPGFLTDVSTALGEDERFDTESVRTSLSVLARQVGDFAARVLEGGDERFTANEPEHFFPVAAVPVYDATGLQAEGLTFGMLVCPVTGRLCGGAAVLTWFGCRYQPAARRCDHGDSSRGCCRGYSDCSKDLHEERTRQGCTGVCAWWR